MRPRLALACRRQCVTLAQGVIANMVLMGKEKCVRRIAGDVITKAHKGWPIVLSAVMAIAACATPSEKSVEARPSAPAAIPKAPPQTQQEPVASVTRAEEAGGPRKAQANYPCANFYKSGYRPTIGFDKTPPPPLGKPKKGVVFADPVYRTCIVRVTDAAHEPMPTFARVDYARRQLFNADDSLLLIYAVDGSWHVYDVRTQKYLKKLRGIGGDAEPYWHPKDPNRLLFLPNNGGMAIYELDVSTNENRAIVDFSQPDAKGLRVRDLWPEAARIWTRSEGSPSSDGRYWAFQVETDDFKMLGMFTYDMQTHAIVGTYKTTVRPDHVTMSPTGLYVFVAWDEGGTEGGPTVFTRDLQRRWPLHVPLGHNDLALDEYGDDMLVSVDHTHGYVYMIRLKDRLMTRLYPIWINDTTMAMHFSGKAYNKPGWVLVSTFGNGKTEWPHQKVFALQLRKNPKIVHLMHHRGAVTTYFAQPQASVNRDFTRFVVNSNWGAPGDANVDTYMAEIPRDGF